MLTLVRSSCRWLPLLLATLLLTACVWWDGPQREYTITGRVIDQDHNPIADVTITAEGRTKTTVATTDEDGVYILPGLRGPAKISAFKEGLAFSPAYRRVTSEGTVDFVGLPAARLSGTIAVQHPFPRSAVEAQQSGFRATAQLSTGSAAALGSGEPGEESDELIIIFAEGTSKEEQLAALASLGWEILDQITILNAYLVRPGERPEPRVLQAQAIPEILHIEPNRSVGVLSAVRPNDPGYAEQWNLPLIRLPQAWSVTTGSRKIRIAVVDSGVKPDHPDLAARLDHRYGYNFVQGNDKFGDDYGHGTHVAGIIGAVTDNALGVAGVMWDVEILPVKVLNERGTGDDFTIAQGLLYAAGLLTPEGRSQSYPGANVINLSLGTTNSLTVTKLAVERVLSETDAIIVAAAGNNGGVVHNPAAYPGVIAVGAVDFNYPNMPRKAHYSSYGPELFIMAPGGDPNRDSDGSGQVDRVLSTYGTTNGSSPLYSYLHGTSMAAPHVSGVIGLMLAAGIPPQEVPDVLRETAIPLGSAEFSPEYGYGLVNAYWAVTAATTMRLVVGTREGANINVVAETSLPAKGGSFQLDAVPPGDYQVFAWVDVRPGNDSLEPGDYFNESLVVHFEAGRSYTVSGTITELGQTLEPSGTRLKVLAH